MLFVSNKVTKFSTETKSYLNHKS